MPTAGRLMAAILFAALSWYVSTLAIAHLPGALRLPNLAAWNALIGAAAGWRLAPTDDRATLWGGLVAGLTTGALIAFLALLIHSGGRMVGLALRERYSGFLDGVADTFQLMFDYGMTVAQPDVLAWGIGGSALAGVISAGAQKRWT